MLVKKTRVIKMEEAEIRIHPVYFKHFTQEFFSPVLYGPEDPIMQIFMRKNQVLIRKVRPLWSFKFYDGEEEKTLEEIVAKIKTLGEFKAFINGCHDNYTIVDLRDGKPYKNVNDKYKSSRFIEYIADNKGSMFKKKDKVLFEPENVSRLTLQKIRRYFFYMNTVTVENFLEDSFIKKKNLIVHRYSLEIYGSKTRMNKIIIFKKGKNFKQEIFNDLIKKDENIDDTILKSLIDNEVVNLILHSQEDVLEDFFKIDPEKRFIEMINDLIVDKSKNFYQNAERTPFYGLISEGELGIYPKSSFGEYKVNYYGTVLEINFNLAFETGMIKVF